MKKYNLLKVLGIALLVVTLLSWCISAGTYSNGAFASLNTVVPIGIYDLFRLPIIAIPTFIQYGLLFLAIGGFYGVINKTEAYSNLIDKIVSKIDSKFLYFTIILFAVLSSLVGNLNILFILVPFFVTILLKQGYDKLATFAATVGSILIGQIGTTFGFTIWGLLKVVFDIKMTDLIFARIILLAIVVALYILTIKKYVNTHTTKKSKKDIKLEENIPLYESNSSKKSIKPLAIISSLMFVLLLIGTYNWYYAGDISLFGSLYEAIDSFEIGGFLFFHNLLGSVSEIGFFTNYDITTILVIASLIIGWVYNLKLEDMVSGFKKGTKEMLKPALYAMLASVIFTAILNMTNITGGNFVMTIVDKIMSGSEQFKVINTAASASVLSFAYNDFYTLLTSVVSLFAVFDPKTIPVIGFVFQTMYAMVMVIAPTSVFLLVGLDYLDVEYKQWIKYIWKYILIVLAVVIAIAFMLTALI